ncbi:MAG: xanthine/uracil permease family protein-like protein [Benniella sp.]|nr:MAG: xanthine/uracil permease family protein-like protein [Benniella sp.]
MTSSFFTRLNRNVARSRVGKHFCLQGSGARHERYGSKFTTELPAWTFMNHIATLKLDLITATAAIACISSLLMGLFANLPHRSSPWYGMGLNAYFTYIVIGYHGSKYQGTLFVFLSLFGVRQWPARLIPQSIKIATGAGIGLYLMFIGAQSSAGIGLIGGDKATFITLTGCVKDEMGSCIDGTYMRSPTTWMGILGFAVISVLLLYIKGAVLFGVLFISTLSWFRGTAFTYSPYTDTGDAMFDYFKKVVTFHPIQSTLSGLRSSLVTFLYVDLLNTTGTLYSTAKFGGYMFKNGDFDGSSTAFLCDVAAISFGACFGVPPVTAFIESSAGITEGGKIGLTSIVTALLFFISLFFPPIFASFPPWATGPAFVVGSMVAKSVRSINWDYAGDAIPAFLTIAMMPLSGRLSPQEKDLKEP